ncbi:Ail/Lom family outer membrane beta-barrel protein [Enterobacter kobei]|uniref:Ail/Lom family outer membrane beta-barrel protein n=1 Tax=Enterobacter kobei TaxID=208224 RepID=UPI003ED91F07
MHRKLSLGYANSHYTGVISGKSPGFNMKYNIENTTGKLGIMASITSTSQELHVKNRNTKGRVSSLSVTAGPSWYINEAVSIYGLVGIKYSKAFGSDNSFTWGPE